MKNKLKEMLLQHKPITEQNDDIDDIWGETVADGAEEFEEIPEDGTPQEDESVTDVPEEVEDAEEVVDEDQSEEKDEDEPTEEKNHTIADAIEESFLVPKWAKMDYRYLRTKANTKKLNKGIDKLEKSEKKYGKNPAGVGKIDKLKAKVEKTATRLDTHTNKYKEAHDDLHENLAKKVLYKPGYAEKMIRDPRKLLKKVVNPSMFAAQVDNMSKRNNEVLKGTIAKATAEERNQTAKQINQVQQAGGVPEHNEKPKVATKEAPKAMPTTKVAKPTAQPSVKSPGEKVVSNAAAAKERLSERLSKVRDIM